MSRPRRYAVREQGAVAKPPNYELAVRSLRDEELNEELRGERGDPGYRAALVAERVRREGRMPTP